MAENSKPLGYVKPGEFINKPSVLNVKLPHKQMSSPEEAWELMKKRPVPEKLVRSSGEIPIGGPQKKESTESLSPAMAVAGSGTVPGGFSLYPLARALKYNVDLIYEWVYSNVDFYAMWGVHKGAQGTLIDEIGGSFEQAGLMVELLRISGYTADFVFGEIRLTKDEIEQLLGTDDSIVATTSVDMLNAGQIPNTPHYVDDILVYVDIGQVWVSVDIDGTDYVFDPSYKTYEDTTGIDIASVLDYDETELVDAAQDGATVTGNSIEHLNVSNVDVDHPGIVQKFKTYGTNLLDWIQANAFDASMQQIIGGRRIQALTSQPVRQTELPNQKPGSTPTTSSTIDSIYFATYRVQMSGLDYTFNAADIYSQLLIVEFNDYGDGHNRASLGKNGLVVAFSDPYATDVIAEITFTITHPFASDEFDATWTQGIYSYPGSQYFLGNAWGPASQGIVDYYRFFSQIAFVGDNPGDVSVLGNSLAVNFFMNFVQCCQLQQIYNQLGSCTHMIYHFAGICGYNSLQQGPYFDIDGIGLLVQSRVGDTDTASNVLIASEIVGNGFEGGIIQQNLSVTGIDTQQMLDAANADEQKIFDTTDGSDWDPTIRDQLVNWDPYLSHLDDLIGAGYRLIIHEDGATAVDSFVGGGYYQIIGSSISGILTGGIAGGTPGEEVSIDQTNKGAWDSPKETTDNSCQCQCRRGDPVGDTSGTFFYDRTDITVGSGNFPYSLSFSRSYSSENQLANETLGLGWTHNLATKLNVGSNGLRACGELSPKEAAAAIAHSFVMIQLALNDSPDLTQLLIAAEGSLWLMNQMTGNAVTVDDGGLARSYVLLVDGTTYNPAPGFVDKVALADDVYSLTSPQQQQWNFNAAGNLSTYVDPAGVTVTYSYDGSDRVSSVTNDLGRTLTLTYTDALLSSVSDGNGRSVSFAFDFDPFGDVSLTTVTDAEGENISYAYIVGGPGQLYSLRLPSDPDAYVFENAYGNDMGTSVVQQSVNNDFLIYSNFYMSGFRAEIVDPEGNSQVRYCNSLVSVMREVNELGQETLYERDGLNRITKITYPELNSVETTYDTNDNVLTKTWHPKPGSGLPDIVNVWTYDATWNKIASFTDGEGNITTFDYDATQGTLLTITRPTIGGETPTVQYTYTARGQVETRTDETGIVDKFEYNATNETLETATRDFGGLNLATAFGYDDVGNVNSITDPRGNETTFEFDNERRMTKRTECAPFEFETNWIYNDNGELITLQRQTGEVDPEFQEWNWAYQVNGDVETITDPAGNLLTFVYNLIALLTSRTDAEGRKWQFQYDGVHRIVTVKDPSGNTSETRTYTDNGMLATITDARGNTTEMEYDGFDRLEVRTYPDETTEEFTYNENNQVETLVTRNGDTITNTYDVLTRLSTRLAGTLPLQTMQYDLAGRLEKVSTPAVEGDPSSGEFSFGFDGAGRLTSQSSPTGVVDPAPTYRVVGYELDDNGNRTKLTWPDTYFAFYVFDELNRLTDIKLDTDVPEDPSAIVFAYDELSRRTGITYINGCSTSYGYLINNDMSSLEHTFDGSSVAFTFGYNRVHQVTSQSIDNSDYSWPGPSVYKATKYGTANNLNQYPSVSGDAFGYDNNGNLTSGPFSASYDVLNRVTQIVSGGTTVDYLNDPFNRQVQKEVDSVKTGFLYDGLQLIAQYDEAMALEVRYVRGTKFDEALIQISGSDITFFHMDRLGSTIAQTDDSGVVLNKYIYSPFGETPSLPGTIFGFTGQRYDVEVGQYNYKLRYYSPSIGRFFQPDPLGYAGEDLNLYAYVGNDPLLFVDQLGLLPRDSVTASFYRAMATRNPQEIQGMLEATAGVLPAAMVTRAQGLLVDLGTKAQSMIPASLTKGKNFPTELLEKTYGEIIQAIKDPTTTSEMLMKLEKVKKVIEQTDRVKDKIKDCK